MSEMKERELHNCFYTYSLNHKATSSIPGQPEPSFHYIQKFYKSYTKITLLNKETHKIFDSQLPCKNHTYRPEITSGKTTRGTRTSKPNGGSPKPTIHVFFKLLTSQMAFKINQDLQSTRCNCVLQRECFQEKNDKFSRSKTHNHTSALENIAYIVRIK